MARKKTTTKKVESKRVQTQSAMEAPAPVEQKRTTKSLAAFLLFAAIVLVGLYLFKNKSLVMVATVDGTPIWRPAFEERIISDSGSRTLDSMVTEQIILNEATKRNIQVTDADIDQKLQDIEKTLPAGTTLEAAIAGQGMTMATLKKQLHLQLLIEKMLSAQIKVTDAEVTSYIDQNREFLTASDEAGLKTEAKAALENQKKNTQFQKLLETLQKNAKVTKYL